MKLTTILPVFFWVLAIALGNYQIVSSTHSKIDSYHNNPPFRIGSISNATHLNNLLDGKVDTIWERKVRKKGEADFFLELKLTHYFDGTSFTPFPIKNLHWIACPGKTLPPFQAKLFLRESINVDKELRLPEDKLLSDFEFNQKGKTHASLNLTPTIRLQKQSHYPEGIYIYTLEMTLPKEISDNDCFAEIQIKE